jgi:hypothetical protein
MSGTTSDHGRRRFVIACLLGGLVALVVFGWLITRGSGHVLATDPLGSNFYDAQATGLLHGHWDVPRHVLGVDGFQVGSKYYMYFGVWPSLLRMPVLAGFGSLSGRLTVPSMLLAFVVLLGGAAALYWRIRSLVRSDEPCSRLEAVVAGVAVFTVGCGTTALYLASHAFVYHEAILWAVAWSVLAYERVIAFAQRPSRARIALAGVFATLSILSRVSVGVGPVIALAIIAAIELLRVFVRRGRSEADDATTRPMIARVERAGVRDASGRTWFFATTTAVVVPAIAYMWMNISRFGTPFGIPWRSQVIAQASRQHRAMLDANGGSLFGIKLVPSTLLQAIRPDALGWSPVFPWLTFQRFPTTVVGDAVFNKLDFTSSVTASMPVFVLLGVVGAVAVVWTRFARSRELALLRAPLIGAAVGAAVALAFTYVAARYLGDWIPLLTLAGFAGLQVLLVRRATSQHRLRWNAVLAAVALVAVFGVWVNFSLGLLNQRLYQPSSASQQAAMLAFQYRVSDALGTGTPDLVESSRLPTGRGRAGSTWIVGDCDALYWSDGRSWLPVEGRPAQGWVRLRADFGEVGPSWAPLVAFGAAGHQDVVGVFRDFGGYRFGLGQPDATGKLVWSVGLAPIRLGRGSHPVEVLADRVNHSLLVKVGRRYPLVFSREPGSLSPRRVTQGPVTIGAAAGLDPFPGHVAARPAMIGDCREVQRRSGSA